MTTRKPWLAFALLTLVTNTVTAAEQLRYNTIPDTISPEAQQTLAAIYEAKARHILEIRSGTPQANHIKQGTQLKWASRPTLYQIERCMAAIWYRNKGQ